MDHACRSLVDALSERLSVAFGVNPAMPPVCLQSLKDRPDQSCRAGRFLGWFDALPYAMAPMSAAIRFDRHGDRWLLQGLAVVPPAVLGAWPCVSVGVDRLTVPC